MSQLNTKQITKQTMCNIQMANCYQNIISNLLEIVSMINDNVQLNGRSEVNKMLSMV